MAAFATVGTQLATHSRAIDSSRLQTSCCMLLLCIAFIHTIDKAMWSASHNIHEFVQMTEKCSQGFSRCGHVLLSLVVRFSRVIYTVDADARRDSVNGATFWSCFGEAHFGTDCRIHPALAQIQAVLGPHPWALKSSRFHVLEPFFFSSQTNRKTQFV